jgi:hypothetical protein
MVGVWTSSFGLLRTMIKGQIRFFDFPRTMSQKVYIYASHPCGSVGPLFAKERT